MRPAIEKMYCNAFADIAHKMLSCGEKVSWYVVSRTATFCCYFISLVILFILIVESLNQLINIYFTYRNNLVSDMQEIDKCKQTVQDVEVPLEIFQ